MKALLGWGWIQRREHELQNQLELNALPPPPAPSFSCLTSDLLGAFALWPLAHHLMSLSFVCLICEMGMLIPAAELLEGLREGWGMGSTQQSARHGSGLLPSVVHCSSHPLLHGCL